MTEDEIFALKHMYFEYFLTQAIGYVMNKDRIKKYIEDNLDDSYERVLARLKRKDEMYERMGIY